jgi:transposase
VWQQARIERLPIGEPARTDLREVFNALLYLGRTGIAWKYLPHDFRTARCTTTTPPGATKASS